MDALDLIGESSTSEVALVPTLPILDAHHHLWIEPPVPQFPSYDGDAVLADQRAGHNIVASIYVEAQSHYRTDGPLQLRPVGETEYIAEFAERAAKRQGPGSGACAGIIAHADLFLGAAVDEVLQAHGNAGRGRLVGIRHRVPFDPDVPDHSGPTPGLLADPRFREGFARLAPAGLAFDAMVFQSQLGELEELAGRFPDTTIVVNHLGGPIGIGRFARRRADGFEAWRESMQALARHDNVRVKLGGLNMHFTGVAIEDHAPSSDQLAALQKDHVLTAIDLFGPARCMFESNFPVDMLNVSYVNVWNTFKKIAGHFSESEKANLFMETARRTYNLN